MFSWLKPHHDPKPPKQAPVEPAQVPAPQRQASVQPAQVPAPQRQTLVPQGGGGDEARMAQDQDTMDPALKEHYRESNIYRSNVHDDQSFDSLSPYEKVRRYYYELEVTKATILQYTTDFISSENRQDHINDAKKELAGQEQTWEAFVSLYKSHQEDESHIEMMYTAIHNYIVRAMSILYIPSFAIFVGTLQKDQPPPNSLDREIIQMELGKRVTGSLLQTLNRISVLLTRSSSAQQATTASHLQYTSMACRDTQSRDEQMENLISSIMHAM
jgi:hypothetical protein